MSAQKVRTQFARVMGALGLTAGARFDFISKAGRRGGISGSGPICGTVSSAAVPRGEVVVGGCGKGARSWVCSIFI